MAVIAAPEIAARPLTGRAARLWADVPAQATAVWTADEFGEGVIAWHLTGGGWRPTYGDGSVGHAHGRREVARYGRIRTSPS